MGSSKKHEKTKKVESFRENLYSRSGLSDDDKVNRGFKFQPEDYEVKENWDTELLDSPTVYSKSIDMVNRLKRKSKLKTLLYVSVSIFTLSIISASYIFYTGVNVISSENVNITSNIPVSTPGGEALSFKVNVENNNGVDLESVDLRVQFPAGTKSADDADSDYKKFTESIGLIPKSGFISRDMKIVLFGEENTYKKILVSVEYRVKGSNALLYREKEYEVLLTSSPISMSVQGLEEIQSGQEIEFSVNLTSNSIGPVDDLLLVVEYPFGFEFISSNPKTSYGKNIWDVGSVRTAEKKNIRLRGKIEGQDEEQRVFKFNLGVKDKSSEKKIGTTFLAQSHSVRVKKPFIGVDVSFDGVTVKEHVAKPGSSIRADILWSNNLQTRIVDSFIEVKLGGNLYNPLTVSADSGFYRSSDSTITWDQTGEPSLRLLEPGAKGSVSFGFGLVPTSAIISAGLRNPQMDFSVSVKGKRISGSSVPENIDAIITRKVKLSTEVNFTSKAAYSSGPIKNTGPLPPKVDQETTYTVMWTLVNTSNLVVNGQVKAVLPSYMKWLDVISPISEKDNVSFQQVGGMIIWDVGEIKPYAGFTLPPREIAFQVSITPSLSQLDQEPVILREATFTGADDFTEDKIEKVKSLITTEPSADQGITYDLGKVTR